MRSNQSVLFLIKGTDRVEETSDILKTYSSKCVEIFYNKDIEKPNYDEVQAINNVTSFNKNFDLGCINRDVEVIFNSLNLEHKRLLSEALVTIFSECLSNRLSKSMITNGYIRCLNTLNKRLSKVTYNLSGDNRILFVGKPDKYDILAFTVLGLCGCDIVICDLDSGVTSECMCNNRFVLLTGKFTNVDLNFLKFADKGIINSEIGTVVANTWTNFNDCKTLEDYFKLIGFRTNDRYENDKWKVLRLEFQGVDDVISYSQRLENFMLNLKASSRPFVLLDSVISKASYDEVDVYKKLKEKDIFSIFNNYPMFKNTGIVVKVSDALEKIVKKHNFSDVRKVENYKDNFKIWLLRYLNKFYTGATLNNVPLMVTYNINSEKEKEFLSIIGCLPLDIVYISPCYSTAYHTETLDSEYKCVFIGDSNTTISKYPTNSGVGKVATMAYNAQQEFQNVLCNDTALFKIKQFKNVNPIVLKTTYEEIGIYWNEPAKFRPSFNSVGDLVTVPTMFVKVNGVNSSYLYDIKKLMGRNTLFYQSFPIQLQPSQIDKMGDLRSFSKQLVFKNSIDFERLIKSSYYRYGVYSDETQQLIIDKVKKLVEMDWCVGGSKNLVYEIIDTVFRLPPNILQMIHNYDFTGEIPKLVIFNGGMQPCTLSDCIVLMFLKLVGFDIVVYAPTGYRIIEQYISSQWFNEYTIGQYDFNISNIDLNLLPSNKDNRKTGFFGKFFS